MTDKEKKAQEVWGMIEDFNKLLKQASGLISSIQQKYAEYGLKPKDLEFDMLRLKIIEHAISNYDPDVM